MVKKIRILFVCTGNSARSQMAEGFAHYYGGNAIGVDSVGTRPAGLNANAVRAMNETGIDISHQTSDALEDKNLARYDYVITLCGDARDSCARIPAGVKTEHWSLFDPTRVQGSSEEVIGAFRVVRYHIEKGVMDLLKRIESGS